MHTSGFISKSFFILLFMVFSASSGFAQEKNHAIKSGETLSSIAKKYKTTIAELIRLNPDAAKGLKAGGLLVVSGVGKSKDESVAPPKEAASDAKTHKVISGESMSRIAKKYKVSLKDLEEWNGIKSNQLKAGQEIVVSSPEDAPKAKAEKPAREEEPVASKSEPAEGEGIHIVTKGETLSAIAKKAGITVAELKKINGLKSNNVNLGQQLKVPGTKEEKPVVQKKEEPKPEMKPKAEKPEVMKPEPAKVEKIAAPVSVKEPGKSSITPPPPAQEIPEKPEEKTGTGIREVNNTLGYTRVVETGFAEAIEGDFNSKKHLCLHKSAPIGSILQVKNETERTVRFR